MDLLKETVINEALFQLTRRSGKGQGAAARSCPLKVTQELDGAATGELWLFLPSPAPLPSCPRPLGQLLTLLGAHFLVSSSEPRDGNTLLLGVKSRLPNMPSPVEQPVAPAAIEVPMLGSASGQPQSAPQSWCKEPSCTRPEGPAQTLPSQHRSYPREILGTRRALAEDK